jgi:SHS2 domain-containing protein
MHEFFEHTADMGIRARAASLDTLFADAAAGLFSLLVANLDAVRPVHAETVRIEAERLDDLLFDWLAELLYLHDAKRMVFSEFDVRLADGALTATARGEPIDMRRHQLDTDVKAITYHGLKVQRDADGWLAEVIVDL